MEAYAYCLGGLCVWRARVIPAPIAAVMTSWRRIASGLRLPRASLAKAAAVKALYRLIAERLPVESLPHLLAEELGGPAASALAERLTAVVENPKAYVDPKRMPPTGWRVVGNPELSDTVIVSRGDVIYTLYLLKYECGDYPDVTLCDYDSCYPLPLALFPSSSFVGLLYDAGLIDYAREIAESYGGITIPDILASMKELREAAVYTESGRAVLHLHVDGDARRMAGEIAEYQLDMLDLRRELIALLMSSEQTSANTSAAPAIGTRPAPG